jgi:hypothetical protein
MQEGQDWCLQCGAGPGGRDGNLGGAPGWRTGAAILGATVLLVAGASVAAYAALTKPKPAPKRVAAVVKQPTVTPTPTTPGTTPPVGGAPGVPTTVTPTTPSVPTPTPTPKAGPSGPVFPPETKTGSNGGSTTKSGAAQGSKTAAGEGGSGESGESQTGSEPPSPILLDTNAASVYNPYGYPATLFGDPSLTIDGEAKTAWTAQVQPEKAPHMAEGLLLDLKSPQKLGSAVVQTSTTGATVEIYGANGAKLPASITDSAWKRLVGLKTLKKKSTTFTLKTNGKSFRYVVLWLAKAPPGSTAAKPGQVAIGEFELFPPG